MWDIHAGLPGLKASAATHKLTPHFMLLACVPEQTRGTRIFTTIREVSDVAITFQFSTDADLAS